MSDCQGLRQGKGTDHKGVCENFVGWNKWSGSYIDMHLSEFTSGKGWLLLYINYISTYILTHKKVC